MDSDGGYCGEAGKDAIGKQDAVVETAKVPRDDCFLGQGYASY
jgi:hypothetical protein